MPETTDRKLVPEGGMSGKVPSQAYSSMADELVARILALIPEHPEIMDMDDPWKLFKVDGFNCTDLGPSLFQASWALSRAKTLASEEGAP